MDAVSSANNSSDFVRKLYKMLEDPSYSSVVRWGDDGDSFVVLENEKFTKAILPKHFKHSNFASFVRQLNKYDFHKVRQNNDDSSASASTANYGPNAWEFKHPEFRANSRDTLDNIRRKAPAPRRAPALNDEQIPIQQIDLMNQQIVAQAQQIESLVQTNNHLQMNHQMVVQELLRLQKTVINHDRIMQDVITFLHTIDAKRRRESKAIFGPPANTPDAGGAAASSTLTPTSQPMPGTDLDEPASPLQHASKLLSDINTEVAFNISGLEQMNGGAVTMPPGSAQGPNAGYGHQQHGRQQPQFSSSAPFGKSSPSELETIVYPMGTTNGIDPMYGDHIHNIPYSIPPKQEPTDHASGAPPYSDPRKRSAAYADPGWIRQPRVLLVEDDPTCRQIGGKFLYSFNCFIDTALDGLEAVSKIQDPNQPPGLPPGGGPKYDLILMDIIMPNLDGVSACHIIRQFDRTPIVAMTSNIRSDDIQMYFQHGMDDVLPKPFTRKSLLEMLEKHLGYLKPDRAQTSAVQGAGGSAANGAGSAAQGNPGPSSRDDVSNETSPAGSSVTWNSPPQFGATPGGAGLRTINGLLGQSQNSAPRRTMAEVSSGSAGLEMGSAQKRPRLHGSPTGQDQQVIAGAMRQ
ncbi:hypothetical protein DV736_g4408, partial [Chaetothyriales sp. CBS 134916]